MILALLLAATTCHARGPLPDPSCTPGAARVVTFAELCRKGSAGAARNVSDATKRDVCLPYGVKVITTIDKHGRKHYSCGPTVEVDHLISLELGGSNDQANLWPEVYEPRPGAHEKDLAENWLHAEVCAGHVTIQDAQREISTDWLAVYQRLNSAQRVKAAKKR